MWYWYVLVGVLAFLAGGAAGFYGGVQYLKKQVSTMSMSEKEIQTMARSMGMNLSQKQLNSIQRNMKKVNQTKPADKKKK